MGSRPRGLPGQLPPRPDPETGLPRPPVPQVGTGRFNRRLGRGIDVDPASIDAPDGQGPVLAAARPRGWRRLGWRSAAVEAATGSLLLLVWVALAGGIALRDPGPLLLLVLFATFVAARALLTLHRHRLVSCSAGAEWLRDSRGRWVRTYELTHALAHDNGSGARLELRDHRRVVLITLDALRNDRDLWALVRNGILHSVAAGARTNRAMRTALDLPEASRR